MPNAFIQPRFPAGRTFFYAAVALSAVAVVELTSLGWAVYKSARSGAPLAFGARLPSGVTVGVEPGGSEPVGNVSLAATAPLVDADDTSAQAPSEAGPSPIPQLPPPGSGPSPIPGVPLPVPTPQAGGEVPIPRLDPRSPMRPTPVPQDRMVAPPSVPDSRFAEAVLQGRAARDKGDMTTALIRFREALAMNTTSAEPLAELALTFEKMNQSEKAGEQWRKIIEMGEQGAGILYQAAKARMDGAIAGAMSQVGTGEVVSQTNPSAAFGIGPLAREVEEVSGDAERFTLRVPVKTRLTGKISVRDVVIQVLFYDQFGTRIQRTDANVTWRWASPPPDWSDAHEELMEVDYERFGTPEPPAPKGKGKTKEKPAAPAVEKRHYYGYSVRVYYQDKLQDSRCEPAELHTQFPVPPVLSSNSNP